MGKKLKRFYIWFFIFEKESTIFIFLGNIFFISGFPSREGPSGLEVPLAKSVQYLQQAVAKAVNDSLLECSRNRLLLPKLGAKKSCLTFVALHLRANNPFRVPDLGRGEGGVEDRDQARLKEGRRLLSKPNS